MFGSEWLNVKMWFKNCQWVSGVLELNFCSKTYISKHTLDLRIYNAKLFRDFLTNFGSFILFLYTQVSLAPIPMSSLVARSVIFWPSVKVVLDNGEVQRAGVRKFWARTYLTSLASVLVVRV